MADLSSDGWHPTSIKEAQFYSPVELLSVGFQEKERVCVCVHACVPARARAHVCVRERDRHRERQRERERENFILLELRR